MAFWAQLRLPVAGAIGRPKTRMLVLQTANKLSDIWGRPYGLKRLGIEGECRRQFFTRAFCSTWQGFLKGGRVC